MALDLDALKAEFAARGGKATVVATGVQTLTAKDIRKASGWQPDSLSVYNVTLRGEDGGIWTERVPARSRIEAMDTAHDAFPESSVESVQRV